MFVKVIQSSRKQTQFINDRFHVLLLNQSFTNFEEELICEIVPLAQHTFSLYLESFVLHCWLEWFMWRGCLLFGKNKVSLVLTQATGTPFRLTACILLTYCWNQGTPPPCANHEMLIVYSLFLEFLTKLAMKCVSTKDWWVGSCACHGLD